MLQKWNFLERSKEGKYSLYSTKDEVITKALQIADFGGDMQATHKEI